MASQQVSTEGEGRSDIVSSDLYIYSVNQSFIPESLADDRSVKALDRFRELEEPSALLFFP